MKTRLLVAGALLAVVAAAHSFLGERLIFSRLFRRDDMPRVSGSDRFTKSALRVTWHLTALAWLGFASVLAVLATPYPHVLPIPLPIAATLFLTGLVIAIASKGKHLAWPIFLSVALLAWFAS